MTVFKSSKEKRRWLYVLVVVLAIYATLFIGQPLQLLLQDQNIQAALFLVGMALSATAIILQGVKPQTSKREIAVWIGLSAVYLMLFLRLGLPERSHMIEYSILGIFVLTAFLERYNDQGEKVIPVVSAIIVSILIGTIDELIQIYIPDRVFDPIDIVFNSLAIVMAIFSFLTIRWVRGKMRNRM